MISGGSRWHTVAYDGGQRLVWVVDDGGSVSVTNDAEAVVAALFARHPTCRFIYRDSMGNWDELRHDGRGRFVGFAPARGLAPP